MDHQRRIGCGSRVIERHKACFEQVGEEAGERRTKPLLSLLRWQDLDLDEKRGQAGCGQIQRLGDLGVQPRQTSMPGR